MAGRSLIRSCLFRLLVVTQLVAVLVAAFPGVAVAHWKHCSNGKKLVWAKSSATYFYPSTWSAKYADATRNSATNMTNNTDFNWSKVSSASSADVTWNMNDYGKTGWDGLTK